MTIREYSNGFGTSLSRRLSLTDAFNLVSTRCSEVGEEAMIFRRANSNVHEVIIGNAKCMYFGFLTFSDPSDEGGTELGRVEIVSKLTSPERKRIFFHSVLPNAEFELQYI
jgi:hypothetical protein